jgi:hypothetical protein
MVEWLTHIGDTLFAVTNDGRLYAALLPTLHWEQILVGTEGVRAVSQHLAGWRVAYLTLY